MIKKIIFIVLSLILSSLNAAESPPVAERKILRCESPDPNLVNIAPFAKLTSTPYAGKSLSLLTDGFLGGGMNDDGSLIGDAPIFPHLPGARLAPVFEFHFPQKTEIKRIRFFQHLGGWRGYASEYEIKADTTGDNAYDKILVSGKDGKVEKWMDHNLEPIKVFAVSFHGIKGEKGKHGCRTYPVLGEFEIYSGKKKFNQKIIDPAYPQSIEMKPAKKANIKALNQYKEKIIKGIYMTPNGIQWTPDIKFGTYASTKGFESIKKIMNMYNANNLATYTGYHLSDLQKAHRKNITYPCLDVLRYMSEDCKENFVLWPSISRVGYRYNVMSELCQAYNKENITLFSSIRPMVFTKGSWAFPRVNMPHRFPCVISSDYFARYSTATYKEAALSGANGIVFGGDECFFTLYKGIKNISPQNEICQKFKKEFGYNLPPQEIENTEKYRKWILFQYHQIGRLFKMWHENAKQANPELIGATLFYSDVYTCCNRLGFGICEDIIGSMSSLETMGTDPYWFHNSPMGHFFSAEATKRFRGATKDKGAVIVPQMAAFMWKNGKETLAFYKNPVMVYGPAVSAIMNGAEGIQFYRGDYGLTSRDGNIDLNASGKAVSDVFSLVKRLEQVGFSEAKIPCKTALLYSRASDDWWQLANSLPVQGKSLDNLYTQSSPAELMGWTYHRAALEVLFRNARPFELFYLDQPEMFKNAIEKFSAIIIPFPYSIGKEAAKILEQAVDSGKKIIILRQQGETNEYGTAYKNPILRKMILNKKFEYLNCDLNYLSYSEFSELLMNALDKALGTKKSFFSSSKFDIEAGIMELDEKTKFIWLLNWENKDAEINIGLKLPDGLYEVFKYDFSGTWQMSLSEAEIIDKDNLKNFKLKLKPYELNVLHVKPVSRKQKGFDNKYEKP